MMRDKWFYVQNDITDPTPYEKGMSDCNEVAKCPICGEPIFYGDKNVLVIDGHEDKPIHENCAVFRKGSLDWFCDVLGIDLCKTSGKEIYES